MLLVVAAGMTTFYSWRQFLMTFLGPRRWIGGYRGAHAGQGHDDHAHDDHAHSHGHHGLEPHESPLTMMVPLVVLAAGALAAGYVFMDHFHRRGRQ